jgi:hypothetical protein
LGVSEKLNTCHGDHNQNFERKLLLCSNRSCEIIFKSNVQKNRDEISKEVQNCNFSMKKFPFLTDLRENSRRQPQFYCLVDYTKSKWNLTSPRNYKLPATMHKLCYYTICWLTRRFLNNNFSKFMNSQNIITHLRRWSDINQLQNEK